MDPKLSLSFRNSVNLKGIKNIAKAIARGIAKQQSKMTGSVPFV
jgi:hypothetical protein